jgi:four helix bundle protein
LAKQVFDVTESVPSAYRFDLTIQLRKAALSVPTNLAEGCATHYSKELVQFISVAKRSVSETRYLLLFAQERGLVEAGKFAEIDGGYEEVSRMLGGLQRSLRLVSASARL